MPNARATNIEIERRLLMVQGWLLEDVSPAMIIKQITTKEGIGDRQAKRLIAEALKRWVSAEEEDVTLRRKMKSLNLKQLKRSLQDKYKGTPEGIRAIVAVEKEIIKIEGLAAPTKVEISGNNGTPIQQNVTCEVVFKDYGAPSQT